jgi:hypothetical protein
MLEVKLSKMEDKLNELQKQLIEKQRLQGLLKVTEAEIDSVLLDLENDITQDSYSDDRVSIKRMPKFELISPNSESEFVISIKRLDVKKLNDLAFLGIEPEGIKVTWNLKGRLKR